MKFTAEIDIMPQKALLDPQGKAVSQSFKNLGLGNINEVRIGKHMSLELTADSKEAAEAMVNDACKKLLVNQITESFSFELIEA